MYAKLLPLALSALSLASAASIPIYPRQNDANGTNSGNGGNNNNGSSSGAMAGPYGLNNANCTELNLQVSIRSNNSRFVDVVQDYSNTTYVTSQLTEFATAMSNWTEAHLPGQFFTNNNTYRNHGYYCQPKQNAKQGSALLNLVHGIGFDASYWDFPLSPEYSFVDHAASYGYSTFRYDRLGCGKSETPTNGFDEVQAPTEVAILTEILTQLRNSTNVGGKRHDKVVGIGHSYGSAQTQAVTSQSPELLDAAVLTGFTANSSSMPSYLNAAAYSVAADVLDHLEDKPRVWLATGSNASDIRGFFYPPYYADAAFDLSRSTEQPVTLGSLTTIGQVIAAAPNFTKPVQVVNGAKDFIFCGSNCWGGPNGTDIPSGVKQALYPAASNFTSYIAENTGHGITPHYSQPEVAETIMQWIADNGL